MSKQLKLKFKKILKKADFTHADLEYHKELIPEAKILFFEKISAIINSLSDEDRARITQATAERQKLFEQDLEKRRAQQYDEETMSSAVETFSDAAPQVGEEEQSSQQEIEKSKVSELKKIFHRIAELTHPDKLGISGCSDVECQRLEKIFKRARGAHDENNWYILYSIALDLGIDLDSPTQKNIDWVEEDIRDTLASISQISALIVWIWYTGDEGAKDYALKNYFQQTYGLELVGDSID